MDMDGLLQNIIGMPNAAMRQKIISAGLSDMEACSRLDQEYVHNACQTVRKSTTGAAAAKDVTMLTEHRLTQVCEYAKFQYMTNGDMDPAACTLERCRAVHDWMKQLQDDPESATVAVFTQNIDKKVWLESIDGYFSIKKGYSGYPVDYVIRAQAAPLVALQWGQPTMDGYLRSQGRHDGHFYAPDNAVVWLFLRAKCHGTNAWNCIRSFEQTRNGRGAYIALRGQYMGADIQAILLRKAERTLETLKFDGKSETLTWEVFVGTFREAIHDLGDLNPMSEEHKVVKFMSAFQVQELAHCDATIARDPALSGNLNATINFLGQMLASSKLKNGVVACNEETDSTDEPVVDEAQTLMARLKQVEALLAKVQKAQSHIQYQKVNGNDKVVSSGDSEPPLKKPKVEQPKAKVSAVGQLPASVLKSPPIKSFTISQRPQAYAKKD